MSREEAIEILIAVAVCDRPILSCDFCKRYEGMKTECKYPDDKEIEQSVLLLKGIKSDQVRPLTLEELRKMDGEPVWIVEYPDWGHWELSVDAEDYVAERDEHFYGMKHDDPDGRYGLHKLGWLAYRQKPGEAVWA